MRLTRIAHSVERGTFSLSRVVSGVGLSLLVGMMLLIVADVSLRRLFNKPILGSVELVEYTLAILVFLTIAYCAVQGGHIAIDVLFSRFPQRLQAVLDSFNYLLSVVLFGLMSWQLIVQVLNVKRMGEASMLLGIPHYPVVFIAAFGSALLTVVLLLQFVETLSGMLRK